METVSMNCNGLVLWCNVTPTASNCVKLHSTTLTVKNSQNPSLPTMTPPPRHHQGRGCKQGRECSDVDIRWQEERGEGKCSYLELLFQKCAYTQYLLKGESHAKPESYFQSQLWRIVWAVYSLLVLNKFGCRIYTRRVDHRKSQLYIYFKLEALSVDQ